MNAHYIDYLRLLKENLNYLLEECGKEERQRLDHKIKNLEIGAPKRGTDLKMKTIALLVLLVAASRSWVTAHWFWCWTTYWFTRL